MLSDKLSQQIINTYQRGFPVCSRPFARLATEFDVSEQQVIECLIALDKNEVLSRLGPVFDHKKAGASTLAAIAAPAEQLDSVAQVVNSFEQVNHNYAREHDYNLWFVVTAADQATLNEAIQAIENTTGYPVLVLPMEKSFHIDLSFDVCFKPIQRKAS